MERCCTGCEGTNEGRSLAATLDAIQEAVFLGQAPADELQRQEILDWIVSRQQKTGPYVGAFAPTQQDIQDGVRLFTGEKLRTMLAMRNILGTEAARALLLLDRSNPRVQDTLERTNGWLLTSCFGKFCPVGECAHSSVSFMRYLAAGGLDGTNGRLDAHLHGLAAHRDGKGRWRRFPFYYTLLALSEMDCPAALHEIRYAAPACEQLLKQSPREDSYLQRRDTIVQRVLARA